MVATLPTHSPKTTKEVAIEEEEGVVAVDEEVAAVVAEVDTRAMDIKAMDTRARATRVRATCKMVKARCPDRIRLSASLQTLHQVAPRQAAPFSIRLGHT